MKYPINTQNHIAITAICKKAQQHRKMCALMDFSGAGKSTSLRDYAMKNDGAYYIQLSRYNSPKGLLLKILNKLQGRSGSRQGTTDDLIEELSIEVRKKYGNNLFIIDEAAKFQKDRIPYFQDIWEIIKSRFGLILAAHSEFQENLEKWEEEGIQGISEFMRRVFTWQTLDRPTDDEVEMFCNEYGILSKAWGQKTLIELQEIPEPHRNFGEISSIIEGRVLESKKNAKAQKN